MRRRHLLLLHPRPSTIPFHPSLHAARSPTPTTTTTSRFHPSRDRTRATTRNVPTTIRITGTRTAVPEDHLSRAVREYSSANRVERGFDVVSRWLNECMRDVSRCGLLRSLRSITKNTTRDSSQHHTQLRRRPRCRSR